MEIYDEYSENVVVLIEPKKKCSHKNTIFAANNEVCSDCGVEVKNDISTDTAWKMHTNMNYVSETGRCHKQKDESRSIFKDVENLDIPKSITNSANKRYQKIIEGEIFRGANRKAIIVACIFYAYLDENECKPASEICKKFNIKKKHVKEGFKRYCQKFPEASKKYIMPKHLVKEIIVKVKIDYSYFQDIYDMCEKLENRSSMLNSSNPQSVAASIVYLFLCTKPDYKEKLNLSKIKFSGIVGLSDITINKLGKEAQKILKLDVTL